MAKPAVEGGNDGPIQEVRIDRGAAHRSCRVPEPKPEFLPMIMHIIIQQWNNLSPKTHPSPPNPTKKRPLSLPPQLRSRSLLKRSASYRRRSALSRSASSRSKNWRRPRPMSNKTSQLPSPPPSQWAASIGRPTKRSASTRSNAENNTLISAPLTMSSTGIKRYLSWWGREDWKNCSIRFEWLKTYLCFKT